MSEKVRPNIEESWEEALNDEFEKPYFSQLKTFLVNEKKKHVIYPPGKQIFSAFNHTPFEEVKVVIIGQDPYHGKGQANGLCFSVADGIRQPPSLQNIFKEIKSDLGHNIPRTGNLETWAKQGVLLLNATLTVRHSEAGSHQNKGWEQFTDAAIKKISVEKSGVVFLLWGRFAQNKAELIDDSKHCILKAAHPSPFAAHKGFFGCRHFSKTNAYLEKIGKKPVDWRID